METNIPFLSYLTEFLLEWEMFETKFIEKIKTHFIFSSSFRILGDRGSTVVKLLF